ncbi:MAG: TIGR03943 family protein [Chloroflexaceae bacterium]|nr:TIGR03943 family protein [Chloroflexaceae bacterium]
MTLLPSTKTRLSRPFNVTALIEAILMSGTAALLVVKWQYGTLAYYIHPRYTVLVLLAALVLFLMGGVRLHDMFTPSNRRPGGLHLLLALPLLLGVVVPAQPLGATTLAGRGLELNNTPIPWQQPIEGDPTTWNLLQWSMALAVRGEALQGEPIDVVGFVFQDERIGHDAFFVGRYVITCCAADGSATGLPVQWPNGETLPVDTWVQVQGTLTKMTMVNGITIPAIAATSVEPVAQPESPYLFP